jgi:hypothetical protein
MLSNSYVISARRRIGKHLVRAGTQEHPTHEPLISRATLAEGPLTGLSFAGDLHLAEEGLHTTSIAI